MRILPRSLELRTADPQGTVYQRLMEWARDVVSALKRIPDVTYTTIDVPASGEVSVTTTKPRSVVVARVASGTVTAAVWLDWQPTEDGFSGSLYGVSGVARVVLRMEV